MVQVCSGQDALVILPLETIEPIVILKMHVI